MEEKFICAWTQARQEAEGLGVRMRPIAGEEMLKNALRIPSGNRISVGLIEL